MDWAQMMVLMLPGRLSALLIIPRILRLIMVRGRVLLMLGLVHITVPYNYVSGLADRFHDVVRAAEQLLWNGCTQSQLGVVAELVYIKVPALTPRLQRLYASEVTAEQMTWHANHQTKEGSMCYPSDVEAWRHYHRTYPDFAAEPHNVRLGMCMSYEYMFLTMVIHGFANPVVVDMKELRLQGMKSHDCHMTYWWDCDDEPMFRVFHMLAGKYIQKTFSVTRSSLVKPLWLANDIWL
ncbi:UNVERIFIED_CONTAM: hypothetical protein Scaly_1601700 [Sesamum calycinum]|uniref:Uncharacterized protein n=1 Tax=Sesamum calycinum TaxID=2727403 RepID=A0AAW2P7V4_9LAMI